MSTSASSNLPAEQLHEPQHTLLWSTVLHLMPGVLILIFYVLTASGVMASGFPPMFAMLLAILFVAIPVELGELFRRGRKYNGRFSLAGIVGYRFPIPWWQYLVFVVLFLVLGVLISGAAGLLDVVVSGTLSKWLPAWFFMNDIKQYASYSQNALMITLVVNLVLNGLAAPVVEELYFRGYLLPRLARFGAWAPLVNAVLFTIYHFWQPYAYLSILALMLPFIYLVWWKRNVYLGIAIHCAINIVGNLLLFGALLSQAK
jgi:membrane protease YdiL (CAAX protease family)